MPSRSVGHRWNLIYSTAVHGISLKTLYRNALNLDTPILLVVADQEGRVSLFLKQHSLREKEAKRLPKRPSSINFWNQYPRIINVNLFWQRYETDAVNHIWHEIEVFLSNRG